MYKCYNAPNYLMREPRNHSQLFPYPPSLSSPSPLHLSNAIPALWLLSCFISGPCHLSPRLSQSSPNWSQATQSILQTTSRAIFTNTNVTMLLCCGTPWVVHYHPQSKIQSFWNSTKCSLCQPHPHTPTSNSRILPSSPLQHPRYHALAICFWPYYSLLGIPLPCAF